MGKKTELIDSQNIPVLSAEEQERLRIQQERVEKAQVNKTWVVLDSSLSEEWNVLILKCINGLHSTSELTSDGTGSGSGIGHDGEKMSSSAMFVGGVDNVAHRLDSIAVHISENMSADAFGKFGSELVEGFGKIANNLRNCVLTGGNNLSVVCDNSMKELKTLMESAGFKFVFNDEVMMGEYQFS